MREPVAERFARMQRLDRDAEAALARRAHIRIGLDFGQRPESAPDAGRRTTLQQHAPFAQQDHERDRAFRRRLPRTRRGQFGCPTVPTRHAVVAHRARVATRPAARAESAAEIHQPLRVRIEIAARQQRLGERPERAFDSGQSGPAVDAAPAREHALHVAVEDRGAHAEREHRDRRGRRSTDAGQFRPSVGGLGEPPAEIVRDDACRRMEVARAGVVAEPAPRGEHIVERRIGQRTHVREPREEALVVRDHRRHLRLLQHDLGQPDAVRIAVALPRKIVAAVHALPRHEAIREISRRCGRRVVRKQRRQSAIRQPLRPPVFTTYMARSASRISWAAVVPWVG